MTVTQETERTDLRIVLAMMLNRTITLKEMFAALGISRNYYYTRQGQPDFPNAEECRRVAKHFDVSFVQLLMQFGLVETQDMINNLGFVPLESSRADRRHLWSLVDRPRLHGLGARSL